MLDAIRDLDPGAWRGALVSVQELRREFPRVSKQEFDASVLDLARQGVLSLHRHDYPASLSVAELAGLVHSPVNDSWSTDRFPGAYFCGVAIRQS
jgi:quercetin dioxygenase-like cupin family protein